MAKWFFGLLIVAIIVVASIQGSTSMTSTTNVSMEQLPSAH
ncbi:hypothetical protein ACOI1C_06895 [Bacillus sp. DJP31]